MTDVRPEKLGDLQQVIELSLVLVLFIFKKIQVCKILIFVLNTCTMEPLNVDSLKKGHISHSGHFVLFNRV